MYLGIDLGTSAVKVVLVDDEQTVLAQASAPLEVQRPRALWSEQSPESWWTATCEAIDALRARVGGLAGVRGLGLSGQMHGATLLDSADRVLRPAILWNDGRSEAQCRLLEERVTRSRQITGNPCMPGFTAPKLLWVAEHEPEIFRAVRRVLLPKDYLRLRLTGEHLSEMSDASGTLWLDVGRRRWSEEMLSACGLDLSAMPGLVEGSEAAGTLRGELAREWGIEGPVLVAGGGGDQAAAAAGVGVVRGGQGLLSLGTSGVYFVAGDAFSPHPERGVHAFCHCLPERWHQMSVILSAASCIGWLARLVGLPDEESVLREVELDAGGRGDLIFLPYLSGERTPHNDPHARGVFFGLTHATGRAELARSVLEGVAFALADGQAALGAAAGREGLWVVGGGARSPLWGRLLASVLERPLHYTADAELGPAFGAARLARLADTGEPAETVCTLPALAETIDPEPALCERYRGQLARYRSLYPRLRESFREPS